MFEEADNFADIFRGGLPYYLLICLPFFIICSGNPVFATSEFSAYRMTQFDVNGVSYGCRASALSLEAKSLYTWRTGRHCVVSKLQDLTINQFQEIRQKAGGLIILLPKVITELNSNDKEQINLLEQAMLSQPTSIPVYFIPYNDEMENIILDITRTSSATVKSNSKKESKHQNDNVMADLMTSISANGYQVIVSGASHSASKNSQISIIQGELAPIKIQKQNDPNQNESGNKKLPLIVLTAHLNTFGLYNEYPLNADAALLLSIAEVFSKMHNTPSTTPKYRLLFLLTESGPMLNFQGVKKWLDENVQLQNVEFVICLDTIVSNLNNDGNSLFMHVSKPPKDGSAINNFYKILKRVSAENGNSSIEGIHKKINLADQQLAWEHERFSMKRLPAFTLSTLKTPKEPVRLTIFKDNQDKIEQEMVRNANILIESLARYMYNIKEDGHVFGDSNEINKNLVNTYLNVKSPLHNNDLKNAFEKYLKNVKIVYDKPDVREPDFMFYEGQSANLNIYKVKPAIFDLFLTIFICAYLSSVYFIIQYFPKLYDIICKLTKTPPQLSTSTAATNHINNHSSKDRNKTKWN